MAKGNPNPSPETRFKPGESGNPGGKSAEQKRDEQEAAAIAAEIRLAMLSSMQEKLKGGLDALDFIDANTLKLFKDSEDRAHGTPKSTSDVTVTANPMDELLAYVAANNKPLG